MASTPNLRLVKCPKCKNTLQKPADLAVYQCGACNAILQSTRWMAGGNNSTASTVSASISSQKNASQHSSEMTKLNHKTKSSSEDTCLTNEGNTFNSEDNLKSAGSANETGEEEEEDIKAVGDKTKTILDPWKNNSDNEIPTNKAKDFLDYSDRSAFLKESPSHGASPSYYHSPTTNMSSPAYEGSISSPDNKGGEHTRNQHRLLVSRRTFRPRGNSSIQKTDNRVGERDLSDEQLQGNVNVCSPAQSSSKCNSSEVIQSPTPRKEDPPHQPEPSIEEFHSTFNSVDSEEGKSFGYYPKDWNFRNQSPSSKFRDIENGRMELLRKVDALRYQLVGSRDLGRKARPPLYGIRKSNQQILWNSTASSMAQPTSYPSSNQQLVSPDQTSHHCCLHCAIICNNGLCTSCFHPSHSNASSNPPLQDYEAMKNIRRAKDKVVKRHCRPILGGANFISCGHCYCVLQIPEDVHFSTTSTHKIQCGTCRNILTFSIRQTNHNSHFTYESVDTYDRRGAAGVPNSYCSEEYEPSSSYTNGDEQVLHVSRESTNSADEIEEGPPSPLHRLMGYYSASEIIYQPPE